MTHLIDTNVVIYYFNGLTDDESLHSLLIKSFNISIITQIEFLGWSKFSDEPALYEKARVFIGYARVFDLDATVAEQTIRLRQQYKIKTPDAIIAATALVNDLTIVTNNMQDFIRLGAETIAVKLR